MTSPDPTERTLVFVERLHYVTPRQLQRRYYGRSLSHVRDHLTKLAAAGYLTQGEIISPITKKRVPGSPFLYSLGMAGWRHLKELGVDVPERWRASEHKAVSITTAPHTMHVNDCLIELELMTGAKQLAGFVHELDFRRTRLSVRPDAWIDIRSREEGGLYQDCYLIEVDRGNEGATFFKEKIVKLMRFAGSRDYQETFGTDVFNGVIVIANTPERAGELADWINATPYKDLFRITGDYRRLATLL